MVVGIFLTVTSAPPMQILPLLLCRAVTKQCDLRMDCDKHKFEEFPQKAIIICCMYALATLETIDQVKQCCRASLLRYHQRHYSFFCWNVTEIRVLSGTPKGERYPYPTANCESDDSIPTGGTLPGKFLYELHFDQNRVPGFWHFVHVKMRLVQKQAGK